MKKIVSIHKPPDSHWVGDGFPVRSILTPRIYGETTPFLLLDYAEPISFAPSDEPKGVEAHPHKGFETVTVVFQGELEHRDSAGHHGRIGPGDVQWMTAGSGLLHEEKHGADFTRNGGVFQVAQLWVNLPARHKGEPPRYQDILADRIPRIEVGAGSVRVIAGDFNGTRGPAHTFTPVELWHARIEAGSRLELPVPEGHTLAVFIIDGEIAVDGQPAGKLELAIFTRDGAGAAIESSSGAEVLVLGGEPIDEPIAPYGPFVMNTQEEIRQAVIDYQSGKMGILSAPVPTPSPR